jgi:maleylacetoacetate isomerase
MMTLFGYWRSSASYRVRIALNLKGIKAAHHAVNLKSGEQLLAAHKDLNSQPLVPILELGGGTRLTQSLAILDYLEEAYPAPPLLPTAPELKAKVRAAAQIIGADIAPIQNLRVLKYIRAEYGQDDAGVKDWAAHWIREGLKPLEALAEQNDDPFFMMGTPGYFEACLIPQIYNANRFGVDMSAFPKLSHLNHLCLKHPAFITALPENQPDADTAP